MDLRSHRVDEPVRAPVALDPCECLEDEDGDSGANPAALEAYFAIRSLLRTAVDCRRVRLQGCSTLCSVLLDGAAEKPICRYRFISNVLLVTFYANDQADTMRLERVNDLYDYADRLRATVNEYERRFPKHSRPSEREVMA
jgi:hypothetical protein